MNKFTYLEWLSRFISLNMLGIFLEDFRAKARSFDKSQKLMIYVAAKSKYKYSSKPLNAEFGVQIVAKKQLFTNEYAVSKGLYCGCRLFKGRLVAIYPLSYFSMVR